MAAATKPAIQECPNCGTLIDVTDEQPLALRHCPNCGAAQRVRKIFNHFELQDVLGAGGMGAVYRAIDSTLKRPVALKLLRTEHSKSPDLIESFAREAAITASINHPNVVKVYSTGTDHGVFYIAMELVDKGSLDDLMEAEGKVSEAQVLDVGIQIAQGLNAACQRGLIHRDIKPGNILFGNANDAKIVDFGLAVLQEHANTGGDGTVWGTPYYVAPEKLDRVPREDLRSDIYSLGATLFHALAGRPPIEAETVSMVALKALKSQVAGIRSFAPEVSEATAYVIDKTLRPDPDTRFASYEKFIESLQSAQAELLGTPHSRSKPSAHTRPISPHWLTYGVVVVIVFAGVGLFLARDRLFAPPKPTTEAVVVAERATAAALDVAYQKARDQIVAGQFAEAAAALHALDAEGKSPQPMRNWISLDAALALFLAGQPAEARQDLQKVVARGPFSTDPTEQKLAAFFVRIAELAATDTPQTLADLKQFADTDGEGFAALLLAAKAWTLGAFEAATPLFEHLYEPTLTEGDPWLEACKSLAVGYTRDIARLRKLTKMATAAKDEEELQQALTTVQAAQERLKNRSPLTEKVAALSARLSSQLAAAKQAREKKEMDEDAADAATLAEALPRVTASYAAFKFTEAQQILTALPVENAKGQAERDAWLKRTDWLIRFKNTLVSEINVIGYTQPLLRKNRIAIPLGLHKASEATAEMVTPYGNVPIPWTDLALESFVAMDQAFGKVSTTVPPAERQWRLGVFLYHFGHKPEGLLQLRQAAEASLDYQPYLPLFPET